MNYEPLIERDLEAIPAAAQDYLQAHGAFELWISVTRFAVLAYAPSQHAKRAVMACRAALALREVMGSRWPDLVIACARYAAESRMPWSEPPILAPPEPSSESLRAATGSGDRLRAERWLSAHLADAAVELGRVVRGDALLLLETATALLPHLGEQGRFALLRMPLAELVANPREEPPAAPLEVLLERAVEGNGSPDLVQPVLVALAREGLRHDPAAVEPYALARDYAQTLLAHVFAPHLPELLKAVRLNLEQGENFAEWSFA